MTKEEIDALVKKVEEKKKKRREKYENQLLKNMTTSSIWNEFSNSNVKLRPHN